jgi:putative salt-induced outer membrane protein YdiY
VEYRVTVSPGVGYYFLKDARFTLSAEAGPGLIYEKVGSEEGGYWTARVAERFTWKINERARLWQSLEFLPQVDDLDNFILIGEIGFEADITKALALRVTLQDNYDNEPAPGRKENDIRLVTSLAYKF